MYNHHIEGLWEIYMATLAATITSKITYELGELRSSLYTAIKENNNALLQSLVEKIYAIDPDELDRPWSQERDDWLEEERTPLGVAIESNNLFAIDLIFKKIEPNLIKVSGFDWMSLAAAHGNPEVIKSLLKHGATPFSYYYASNIHSAMESLGAAKHSLINEADWGAYTSQIRTWYNYTGDAPNFRPEFSSTPRIKWYGPLAAMKALLEAGANPMLKDENGITCLQIAEDPTSPNHTKLFGKGGKLLRCENGNPILEIELGRKDGGDHITIIVEYDRSKQRALLAEYAEKNKMNGHREREDFKRWLRLKEAQDAAEKKQKAADQKMEEAKRALEEAQALARAADARSHAAHENSQKAATTANRAHNALARTVGVVSDIKENFDKLHDQHVNVFKAQQQQQQKLQNLQKRADKALILARENKDKTDEALSLARENKDRIDIMWKPFESEQDKKKRVEAITRDKSSPKYAFYNAVGKQLDALLDKCKLLISDPNSKCNTIASVINGIAEHAPAPFNIPGKLLGFLVKKYGQRKERAAQLRVTDLIPRDHGPMCDDLALFLTEHFASTLADVPADKAKKLGFRAVALMLVLMSDEKSTLSPTDPDDVIQEQLFTSVIESQDFNKNLAASVSAKPVAPVMNSAAAKSLNVGAAKSLATAPTAKPSATATKSLSSGAVNTGNVAENLAVAAAAVAASRFGSGNLNGTALSPSSRCGDPLAQVPSRARTQAAV